MTPRPIAIIAENIPYIKENLCAKEKMKELDSWLFNDQFNFSRFKT